MLDKIIESYSKRIEVEAILLGGSRATNTHDEKSDYDVYVYLNEHINEEDRRTVLDPFVQYMEYSNEFWELEDDGVLNNGIEIEFIYRNINDIKEQLDNTIERLYVGHGYSTCFIDNLQKSKILFDRNGLLQEMKEHYNDVPDEVYEKIISYNLPLVYEQIPAMYKQVKKAMERNDLHSINHRVTAFFEVYYDCLYALNKQTHPGEKRLLELAMKLERTPENFEDLVSTLFTNLFHNNEVALDCLERLSKNLITLTKE